MIERHPLSDESGLIGKYIFHSSKGGIALLDIHGTANVCTYLGKVTDVSGPNRIFYQSDEEGRKYVSLVGIGYVCDTPDEAARLVDVFSQARARFEELVTNFSVGLEKDISDLVRVTTDDNDV